MKIRVVRVGHAGAVGTPDEFEQRYERIRKKGSGRVQQRAPEPKLKPVENKSLDERMADLGIQQEV
jgi:hypothetical protein